jgi:hypothetical protein
MPCGSKRRFIHMEYWQLATLHASSVHLHITPSRRYKAEFLAHLKDGHFGEQALDCANRHTPLMFL